jgi:hypothetical protein
MKMLDGVLALAIAAALPLSVVAQAKAPAGGRLLPREVAAASAPKPTDGVMTFDGQADGIDTSSAIDNAKRNAIALAVAELAGVMFANPEYVGLYGAQALGEYASSVGRFTSTRAAEVSSGRFRGYARLELKRAYAQVSAIRQYAPQAPLPSHPLGIFVVPVLRLSTDKVPLRVEVRAGDPSRGSFVFQLGVRRVARSSVWLRVESIRVVQDGSAKATSWGFDIWANGLRVLKVPDARYDDRIGNYPSAADDKNVEATVRADGAGYVEFHVIATKPASAK